MADPEHEEHENMLHWRGPFDPDAFSLMAVNQQLASLTRTTIFTSAQSSMKAAFPCGRLSRA